MVSLVSSPQASPSLSLLTSEHCSKVYSRPETQVRARRLCQSCGTTQARFIFGGCFRSEDEFVQNRAGIGRAGHYFIPDLTTTLLRKSFTRQPARPWWSYTSLHLRNRRPACQIHVQSARLSPRRLMFCRSVYTSHTPSSGDFNSLPIDIAEQRRDNSQDGAGCFRCRSRATKWYILVRSSIISLPLRDLLAWNPQRHTLPISRCDESTGFFGPSQSRINMSKRNRVCPHAVLSRD